MLTEQIMHDITEPNVFVIITKIFHMIGCPYLVMIYQSQFHREPLIFLQTDFRINIHAVVCEKVKKIIRPINHLQIFLLAIVFRLDN